MPPAASLHPSERPRGPAPVQKAHKAPQHRRRGEGRRRVTSSSPDPAPATASAPRYAHRPGSTASSSRPAAEIAQPATMIGRRPSVSAARPAGSSAAAPAERDDVIR
jgi:hypothetical protein